VTEPIISLRGVGKRYLKYQDRRMLFSAALRLRGRTSRSDFWAVRDVDLEVGEGESVEIGRAHV